MSFGLVNELLDPEAPIAFAIDQVREAEVPAMALLDLSGAGEKDLTTELVHMLAGSESPCSADELRDKWLYLVLTWVDENRHGDPDPLQRVEDVYGDFGYPKEIESLSGTCQCKDRTQVAEKPQCVGFLALEAIRERKG